MSSATSSNLVWHKYLLPFWNYLNQPLFDSRYPAILNPVQFWRTQNVQFLKHCLSIEPVNVFWFEYQQRLIQLESEISYLENCWYLSEKWCDSRDL